LDPKKKDRVVFAPITKSAQHSKKKKTERQKNAALTSDAVPDAISGEKTMEEQETRQDGKHLS
jgi:hypothetical protein